MRPPALVALRLARLTLRRPRAARIVWLAIEARHPDAAARALGALAISSAVAVLGAIAVWLWAPWTGPAVTAIAALGLPGVAGLWAGAVLSGEGVR